jgi:hypothetical protein
MQKSTIRSTSRRRSKGTIAGFAFGKSEVTAAAGDTPGELPESASQGTAAGSTSPNQPQHSGEKKSAPTNKPCNSARLTLLCVQNTLRMGARTQLYLCPPGRSRRDLQTQLRDRSRQQQRSSPGRAGGTQEAGGSYYSVDRMLGMDALEEYDSKEEDFLRNANTFSVDSDEEASSGDDDELVTIDTLFSEERGRLDDDRYSDMNEPLFVPVMSNAHDSPMAAMGRGSGKLPFNRRKLRYFDLVAADERDAARKYLRKEMQKSRKRQGYLLSRHLRRMQREEMRRKRQETGEPTDDLADSDTEAPADIFGVASIDGEMTPALSAALLLESLSVNAIESLEGMAKCYEGIVDAGVALADAQTVDPTQPAGADEKARASRSEVMAALAPLLITSLEQPSGEVILMLAKLRQMCGTARYQRRFVQRVAPALIRPPRGAMWCLRHQNDMEAILAAAELIFDSAFDMFSKGWYERGRLMLADSKRAKTLQSAAMQLRSLSSEPTEGLGRGPRRRRITAKKNQDMSTGASEPLAEWEVIAVDRQIRISISNVISSDWSRALLQADAHKPLRRPASSSKRYGALMHSSSVDMSPKAIASPRSPARIAPSFSKLSPMSPPHMPSQAPAPSGAVEAIEHVFGPAFSSQQVSAAERVASPPPPSIPAHSPPATSHKVGDLRTSKNQDQTTSGVTEPPFDLSEALRAPLSPRLTSLSPGNSKTRPKESQMVTLDSFRSLSPSAIGSSSIAESKSGQSSISTALTTVVTSQTAQYRTLTSTAAERKRTVAACRALRAQIQRFEDAFIQLHGRPPKGTSERAPLATTYAQYREWKRAIRADAACRIQALFRGASTRWILLRSNNPAASRVVLRRAGRPNEQLPDLNLPVEISDSEHDPTQSGAESDSSNAGPTSPLVAPQWPSRQLRPRVNLDDRPGATPEPVMPPLNRSPSPPSAASVQSAVYSATTDFSNQPLSELQAKKRDLKQQLKQYDMNFARRHGRMPVKAEKEPIRHLYEAYNTLKNQISLMEKEGRHMPSASSPVSSLASRAVSPSSAASETSSLGFPDDGPAKSAAPVPRRTDRRRVPSPPVASASAPSSTPPDLATLKAEKSHLHQMLRSYEKEFFRDHKRQVSSFTDIKPVAAQYRRYKEIKKAIAALQRG